MGSFGEHGFLMGYFSLAKGGDLNISVKAGISFIRVNSNKKFEFSRFFYIRLSYSQFNLLTVPIIVYTIA
jgi:hypothetical protein